MMDSATPQCHAYRITGERCDDVAGHEGLHSHSVRWTNEECWTPEMSAAAMIETKRVIETPDLEDDDELGDDGMKPPAKCFACGHGWHGDEECERTTEGMPCGCSTAVA